MVRFRTGDRPSIFEAEIRSLPSGYRGIPRQVVEASQLQRLRHGVLMAVAEHGYGQTTIAAIAERAGVSKKTFYEHFPDKQSCFVEAYEYGRIAVLDDTTAAAVAAVAAGRGPVEQIRQGTGAFLDFMTREADYAKIFLFEILSAGPAAVDRYLRCRADFTAAVAAWHRKARVAHPDWPEVPPIAYEQATAVVHGITLCRVAADRAAELGESLEELVEGQLAVLRVPANAVADEASAAPGSDAPGTAGPPC
ncbi:TetR/AcrR family transcriptional regulator [Nocardia sp. BMG111209]|uniref:TetR/AcrR family transcriptional regulator n=1 Tax=Nocardia sp. BMG111209 TaxID=1160137 RepID=UPI00037AFF62|nr:TetR/AcrR family transcriptional regulator [Nocardia sp. BMG111209]